jgi:hypothetical protein
MTWRQKSQWHLLPSQGTVGHITLMTAVLGRPSRDNFRYCASDLRGW